MKNPLIEIFELFIKPDQSNIKQNNMNYIADGIVNNSLKNVVIFSLLIGIAGFLLGIWTGSSYTDSLNKDAAINAGAARWVIDNKTGKVTFEYIKGNNDGNK